MKKTFMKILLLITGVFFLSCSSSKRVNSRIMNDSNFKRADWLHNTNVYEVNVRQYTPEGTFNAFMQHLPRLKEMGVEVLWFMPVHPIGLQNRKGILGSYYSIKDFKAINPEFGNLSDFKNLVKKAHELQMKVIIDWVANHTAWDNIWTKTNPEFYKRDSAGNFQPPWDWTDVLQIDHSNENEQNAMIDAMQFWVKECDIDGFRADLAHLTPLPFWEKARKAIEPIKPGLFWLAESEEISYHKVFDATYTWEWMHKSEDYFHHKTKREGLDSVLEKYQNEFPRDAFRLFFTTNHDENSWNGTEYEKYGEAAKALAVFSCTWNGIPMIYSGQEIPNKKRLKFFEKDNLHWPETPGLHEFYKKLLGLHKTNPALKTSSPDVTTTVIRIPELPDIFAFARKNGNNEVFVILNFYKEPKSFNIENDFVSSSIYNNVLDGGTFDLKQAKKISLPAYGYLVLEKRN